MTKRVQVKVVGIRTVSAGDDELLGLGTSLEIYGHLGAWRVGRDASGNPQDRQNFIPWNFQNDGSAVSIGLDAFPINATSPDLTIEQDEELWVGGHLKEADTFNENDSMGDRHIMIRHNDIRNGPFTVRFEESQQVAEADFFVTVL